MDLEKCKRLAFKCGRTQKAFIIRWEEQNSIDRYAIHCHPGDVKLREEGIGKAI